MPQISPIIKIEYLILLSFLLTFVIVSNAFYIKRQFYPSVTYLTNSNISLVVLYIQAFVCVILLGKLLQRIFFGPLRAIEIEHLYERTWFSLSEICLALMMFRDDFNPLLIAAFVVLLALKCFHWLLEDRIDYIEQIPVLGTRYYAQTLGLWCMLFFIDCALLAGAYAYGSTKKSPVYILFGFEYLLLLVFIVSCGMKYCFHLIEIQSGQPWDNKGACLRSADFLVELSRIILYTIFIIIMMKIHTFPLFSIRPMIMAIKGFRKACYGIIESERALYNLETFYPTLTVDELTNIADRTCTICRADMQIEQRIKRLPCQHVFHDNCLYSWFQRQQTCPICRATVLRSTPQQTPPAQADVPAAEDTLPPSPPSSFSASTTTVNPTTAQTSLLNMSVGIFPSLLPTFPFPPPPLPSVNLTDMSNDVIQAMNGIELSHVKARIQCLRNVRMLLDASMIQMQQYMNIVSTQSNMENGARLLTNLNTDIDQILPVSTHHKKS